MFVPAALKHEVLLASHDDATAGHLGIFKTYEKLHTLLLTRYVPKHTTLVTLVHSFRHEGRDLVPAARPHLCLYQSKAHSIESLLIALVLYPLLKSGNSYLVVFSDYLTHWLEEFAVPSIDTPVIAKLFVNEIGHHGPPCTLLSDKGQNLMIRKVCKIANNEKVNTTAYHPQTDGLVEQFNSTLVSISMYVSINQEDWDEHLQRILLVSRVSPSEITGNSPFYLLYGHKAHLPLDVSSIVEHRLCTAN